MKRKMTRGKGNLTHRLVSVLLAAALTLGLLPSAALAAGTVTYLRKRPEFTILNAYTGSSTALYKKLKSEPISTDFGSYNVFDRLFHRNGIFPDTQSFDWDYSGVTYADSVMRQLSKVYGNLEVNLSGTFYNRAHTHTHAKKLSKYAYEIVDYEKVYLEIGDNTPVILAGAYPEENKEVKYPRVGDYDGASNDNLSSDAKNTMDSYGVVRYSADDTTFKVNFVGMDIGYYHFGELKTCTCTGTYAENMVMTFRDARAPRLTGVYYSLDGGASWTRSTDGLRAGAGSTLLIKLSYDEPIRFADDSAAGKEQLYLELQEDGTSTGSGRNAYLTRLEGNDLYFSYTFDTADVNWEIQALSMAKLFGGDLTLKQVNGARSFRLDAGQTGKGFTSTDCYITDLAGNALTDRSIPSGRLILDSEAPYVSQVQFRLTLNNAEVKAALNKTDPADRDYTDNSDLYLGAGDAIGLVIQMNERLKDSTLSGMKAVATTNLRDESGSYVTVESRYFSPESERLSGDKTACVMKSIEVQAGWSVDMTDNPKGEIRVIGLRFTGGETDITDLAGNRLNKADVAMQAGANANPPQLDVTPPEAAPEGGEAREGSGFRYGVRITDDASGTEDIYGSFILRNGGDGKRYDYEWLVTATPTTTQTQWNAGKAGVAQTFKQTQPAYIHIRPKAGVDYDDFSGCTLTIKARDYAGNEQSVTLPAEGTLTWYIDNLPPAMQAGGTTRALKSDPAEGGTLTAEVILTDNKGISGWEYAWGDSKQTAPAAGWTPGDVTATTGSDPVTVTAVAEVANGQQLSHFLWVRATDNAGYADADKENNTSSPVCLGKYIYDLRGAQYALDYEGGITPLAAVQAHDIGTQDVLYFLVRDAGADTGGAYAVYRVDGSALAGGRTDIFSDSTGWSCGYTCTVDDNGIYTLTQTTDTAVQEALRTTIGEVVQGRYSGTLSVTILSGKRAAVSDTSLPMAATLTLGNGEQRFYPETVTLRVASRILENYEGISITSSSDLGGDPNLHGTATLEHPHRASLAGMVFDISIARDKNGWNYADVDWENSYVALTRGEGAGVRYTFRLRKVQAAEDGSIAQTVIIPEDDYQSGVYYATLHLQCRTGKEYQRTFTKDGSLSGETAFIVVDTTQPNNDFSLTAMTYTPRELPYLKYGIAEYYGTLDCLEDGGVITLPVPAGPTFGTGDPCTTYQFTVSSPTEQPAGGWYRLQMWNAAEPEQKITLKPADDTQQTVKNFVNGFNMWGFVFDKAKAEADPGTYLYLAPDTENTVAMQKVYSNGLTSDVKTVTIKPVTQSVTGTVHMDADRGELVFTPDDPAAAIGARMYAWTWQNNQDPLREVCTRIDMKPANDGTWRCALVENGAIYEVITVSRDGVICDAGFMGGRAPWFDEMRGMWGDNGMNGIAFTDNGDGTYALQFEVRDDYQTIQNGLSLDISFNPDYSDDHLAFTVKKGSGAWTENAGNYIPNVYTWNETGVSDTGIYAVEVTKSDWSQNNIQSETYVMDAMHELDLLRVTVRGCFKDVTGVPMVVTVTATDATGNRASVSTAEQTVTYRQPSIYGDDDAERKPTLGRNGLILNFNQPVRPADSWAWQESDSSVTGFHTRWEGAFPVIGNGAYDLQFIDIFGNVQTQTLTTDAFTVDGKDYSVDLSFSNAGLTGDPVTVTAGAADGYLTFWDGFLIWKEDGRFETVRMIDENGTEWPASPIRLPSGTPIPEAELKNFGMKLRAIRWSANGKMEIGCADRSFAENNAVFFQTVYIGNIAKAAPPAEVRYFVYALGEEFTQAGLAQYIAENGGSVTLTGNVEVWYKTTRSVTPVEGGSQYLFTPENYAQGHTFTYADDAGNRGSVYVTLPAGLTLAEPAEPQADTTAPSVEIDIYTKTGGSYTRAEAFGPGDADITERFARLGYVQGYSLTVNASDASGYDIAVSGDGASLSGNIVTITQAGDCTITVTDRSENRNAASVTFTVPAKLDNTPPEGELTVTADSLYEKTMTITLTDKDDAGQETANGDMDTVTLTLPSGAERTDKNTYTYPVTKNGDVAVEFYDLAGNRGTAGKTVTGIDTDPPVLAVRWSPADPDSSGYPPAGPVNTNVTARIRSDKALQGLTVQAANETDAHDLLVDGAAQPYTIFGPDSEPLVTITPSPERITVTYFGNYDQPLTLFATAPNGRGSTMTLSGLYAIDKTPPSIDVWTENQCRWLSPTVVSLVPYAVKVTLEPDEWVTSPNYGEMETVKGVKQAVQYGPGEPLELTFTENGTYHVRFVDLAGNVTIQPVELTKIDNTPPRLTVTTVEAGSRVTATVTADENCTVTVENTNYSAEANVPFDIVFTQNGTFTLTAVDYAINKSFKTIQVGSIDGVAPTVSFAGSTIYMMEGAADLDDRLQAGFEYSDNVTPKEDLTVRVDKSAVDLTRAGQYTVIYTVTDKAGNSTSANRFVRVIGKDTVCLKIDEQLILPDSTAVLRPGAHTLTLSGSSEPYTIKARRGILSAGQMKYLSGSSLRFDENGGFTATSTGYYTLLVTTQSRQTIRILLYVEQ